MIAMHTTTVRLVLLFSLSACCVRMAAAQSGRDDIPLLSPEEKDTVARQTQDLFKTTAPLVREAAKSTVWVYQGNRQAALGTVINDGGEVLTKWSEAVAGRGNLNVVTMDGTAHPATIHGVYEKEDLAVLKLDGNIHLPPIKWSTAEEPGLGRFLIAAAPGPDPTGFGVVSVAARDLRDTDQAFLGVMAEPSFSGPGAKVAKIEENSGAKRAGLRAGDIIISVGGRKVSGFLEMRNALTGRKPDETISLLYTRDGKESMAEVILGHRPELPKFFGDRLETMERMGGPINEIVRDGFSHVIQTDMALPPNKAGGPVADLQGNAVGLAIARAGRTRSFVIPAATIHALLKTPTSDPAVAEKSLAARLGDSRMKPFGGAMLPMELPQMDENTAGRIRSQLEQMQRMMQEMQEEMGRLEGR